MGEKTLEVWRLQLETTHFQGLLLLVSGMVIHQPGLPKKEHTQIILKLRYPKNGADIIYLLASLGFFVLLSWFSLEMECLQDILAFNHKEL